MHQPGEDAGGLVGRGAQRASAEAMPNSSNQARVDAGEPRVRIERVRTASIAPAVLSSCAQKASSVNSASSRVAGAAEQPGHLVHQFLQVVAHRRPVLLRTMAIAAVVIQVYESTRARFWTSVPGPEG